MLSLTYRFRIYMHRLTGSGFCLLILTIEASTLHSNIRTYIMVLCLTYEYFVVHSLTTLNSLGGLQYDQVCLLFSSFREYSFQLVSLLLLLLLFILNQIPSFRRRTKHLSPRGMWMWMRKERPRTDLLQLGFSSSSLVQNTSTFLSEENVDMIKTKIFFTF